MGGGTGTGKAVESLEDLTNITFPKSVDEREAYRILEFVSGDLGYDISLGNFSGFYTIKDGEIVERYINSLSGAITSKDFSKRAAFEFLRGEIEESSLDSFLGIRFDTIPGYNLEDHEIGEIDAWIKIKESVERYFKAISDTETNDSTE